MKLKEQLHLSVDDLDQDPDALDEVMTSTQQGQRVSFSIPGEKANTMRTTSPHTQHKSATIRPRVSIRFSYLSSF